jgi:TP901 family phage tail tape measure protein
MLGDNTINIVIGAVNKAKGVFDNVSKQAEGLGDKMKALGTKMKSVGSTMTKSLTLPIVALGTAAGKMSMDFEAAMTNVSTLVDTNVESMSKMSDEVLAISKRTPVALSELTSALYDVRSAGIEAEGAMSVLENAAKLATAGLGTTKEATDILTSAINAFGLDASRSEQIAGSFFLAVKRGKTTVSELAQGFGQVAPLASELGVAFEELIANTAAMTTSGMKASIAYTQQRAILSNLLKPTKEMQEAMGLAGITSENLSETISEKGLTGTLKMLTNAVDGNQGMMAKMFGSVEGLNGVLMLLGDTGENAAGILAEMSEGGIVLNEAFDKQKESAAAMAQIIKNQLNASLIVLGDAVLPVVLPLVQKFATFVSNLAEKFKALDPETQKMIVAIAGIVAVIGPLLMLLGTMMPAIVGIGTAIAFLATPVGIALLALGALFVACGLLLANADKIRENWNMIWEAIGITLSTKIKEIQNSIQLWITKVKAFFISFGEFFISFWDGVKNAWRSAIDYLKNLFQPLLDIISRVQSGVGQVKGFAGSTISKAMNLLPFQKGGIVPGPIGSPVPALVHGGEMIVPAGKTIGTITVNITGNTFMSDREAAEKIGNMLMDTLKLQFNVR